MYGALKRQPDRALNQTKKCKKDKNSPNPCLPWPARSLIRFMVVVEIIMNIGKTMLMVIIMIMVMVIMMPMMLTTPWAVSSAARTSNCRRLPPRCLVPLLSAHSGSSPLPIIHSSDNKTTLWEGYSTAIKRALEIAMSKLCILVNNSVLPGLLCLIEYLPKRRGQ